MAAPCAHVCVREPVRSGGGGRPLNGIVSHHSTMANGREPDCVICVNFRREHQGPSASPIVGDPSNRCLCALHKVVLPYSRGSADLLICRDWADHKGGRRLVDWRNAPKYQPGILYSYKTIYSSETAEYGPLSRLPSADGLIKNDG